MVVQEMNNIPDNAFTIITTSGDVVYSDSDICRCDICLILGLLANLLCGCLIYRRHISTTVERVLINMYNSTYGAILVFTLPVFLLLYICLFTFYLFFCLFSFLMDSLSCCLTFYKRWMQSLGSGRRYSNLFGSCELKTLKRTH